MLHKRTPSSKEIKYFIYFRNEYGYDPRPPVFNLLCCANHQFCKNKFEPYLLDKQVKNINKTTNGKI